LIRVFPGVRAFALAPHYGKTARVRALVHRLAVDLVDFDEQLIHGVPCCLSIH
jgi:hypothetical protein